LEIYNYDSSVVRGTGFLLKNPYPAGRKIQETQMFITVFKKAVLYFL